MALTRKWLAAMGIEEEKIDEIVNANSESLEAVKADRDRYKADAEKLPAIQKELDELKEAAAKNPDGIYKQQYVDLKAEYDTYKADVEAKSVKAKKTEAYRKLLKDANVSEKRIDSILRVSNIDKLELDNDGALKDTENLKKSVETEWADFIVTDGTQGAQTPAPPASNGETRTPSRAAQIAAQYVKNLYGIEAGKGED